MRPSNIAVPLVAVAVVFLCSQPVQAADLFFAGNGSGTTCSQSAPCLLSEAINLATATPPVVLSCADSSDVGGLVERPLKGETRRARKTTEVAIRSGARDPCFTKNHRVSRQ
jgi:hypothetical protein